MTKLGEGLFAGLLAVAPTFLDAQSNLQEMPSSEIKAEIDFLSDFLQAEPPVPEIPSLSSTESNALMNALASNSICEGRNYQQYIQFVSPIEAFDGGPTAITLGKRSYEARAENGCNEDLEAIQTIDDFLGSYDRFIRGLEEWAELVSLQEEIEESLDERVAEMIRRTLSN